MAEFWVLQDVAKGITKVAIRESRARDLRDELTNSEKYALTIEVPNFMSFPDYYSHRIL